MHTNSYNCDTRPYCNRCTVYLIYAATVRINAYKCIPGLGCGTCPPCPSASLAQRRRSCQSPGALLDPSSGGASRGCTCATRNNNNAVRAVTVVCIAGGAEERRETVPAKCNIRSGSSGRVVASRDAATTHHRLCFEYQQ